MDKCSSRYQEMVSAWAPLAVRVPLGLVFMAHGAQKLFGAFGGKGISGTIESMAALGLAPAVFWGWVVALTEFFGGAAVFAGIFTRTAGILITITMLVAIVKVHGKGGFFMSNHGYEYNLVLIGMALSLVISGPGKLALSQIINCRRT